MRSGGRELCERHAFWEAEVVVQESFWCKVDNGCDPIAINDFLDVLRSGELLKLEAHGIDW
jgi:hypothetical protein